MVSKQSKKGMGLAPEQSEKEVGKTVEEEGLYRAGKSPT